MNGKRLYLVFINSSHISEDVKKIKDKYPHFHHIEVNILGLVSSEDSNQKTFEIRDELIRVLSNDVKIFVIRCIDGFNAAWFMSREGSDWIKSHF